MGWRIWREDCRRKVGLGSRPYLRLALRRNWKLERPEISQRSQGHSKCSKASRPEISQGRYPDWFVVGHTVTVAVSFEF